MSMARKKSLKDVFKATLGAVGIGAVATIGGVAIAPVGLVATASAGAAAAMGIASRKKWTFPPPVEDVPEVPAPEIEISVETAEPVKTMKRIRLRV